MSNELINKTLIFTESTEGHRIFFGWKKGIRHRIILKFPNITEKIFSVFFDQFKAHRYLIFFDNFKVELI